MAATSAESIHADGERFERLREQPRIEGAHRRAGVPRKEAAIGEVVPVADDGTAEHSTLAIDVLRGGMHHDLRPVFEWALQVRCGEAVVDHERNPASACALSQPGEVDQFEPGIAWGLDVDQPGVLAEQTLPAGRIANVGVVRVHPPFGEHAGEDLVRRTEERTSGDDMVA